jgi:polar amino acid transport system permease protein
METIFKDQMEAGLSTGMSKIQTLRHLILPQAYRLVIPAWTNEFCSLTKSTSTLAFACLPDLTSAGLNIRFITFQNLPVWIVIGAIYFVWITGFSKLMDVIYEKKKVPGVEVVM